jgi:hypothetical protein
MTGPDASTGHGTSQSGDKYKSVAKLLGWNRSGMANRNRDAMAVRTPNLVFVTQPTRRRCFHATPSIATP